MQGFTSGPFYVVIFTLFNYLLPLEKRGRMRAIILTIFSLGSVIGASWGGWVTYEWHWRWVFYLNVPFLLSLAGFLWFRLKEFDFEQIEKKPFDGIGYLIFFIGVFSLSSALIMGQQLDWFRSNIVITLVSIGVILIPFFILWELHHCNPIVPVRLLKNPVLAFSLFHLGVLYAAYFGMIVLLSLWLKLYVNYTPDWIAVIIGTMAIASIFPWFLIERKWDEYDCRICLGIAILTLAISCFYTTHFNVEINFGRVAYSRILAGVGLALFLMPLFRLCIFAYKVDADRTNAFGMLHLTRALASGLGAGLFATMWQRRQVFYHDRLGANLTAFSQETKTFFVKAQQVQQMGLTAKEQLEFYLQQQATALALDDCFYMMGWMLVGLLCTFGITIFFKKGSFSGRTKPLT